MEISEIAKSDIPYLVKRYMRSRFLHDPVPSTIKQMVRHQFERRCFMVQDLHSLQRSLDHLMKLLKQGSAITP